MFKSFMDQFSLNNSDNHEINCIDQDSNIPEEDDPEIFDSKCDPNNPIKITFEEICMAEFKIRKSIIQTSCDKSKLSNELGMDIYLKKEFQQFTGSFKERGAKNALTCLTQAQKEKGVISASAGNHALALAYHGREMNIPVKVVMPTNASLIKIKNCSTFGAEILLKGKDFNEAKRFALKLAKSNDITYINGYDHPDVLAGQGTIGLQIAEQISDIDAVIIPVGGGGLIAGMAVALKTLNKNILIYGVESVNCPSLHNSIKAGKPIITKASPSIADGLSVATTGVNAFYTVKDLVDRIILVKEDYIALSILRLIEVEKIVIEGAAAVALAPLLSGDVPELKGKKVVLCLCGGNIDTSLLSRCIERGLVFAGRLLSFIVILQDCPGSIMNLSTLLFSQEVSIKDMIHERASITSDIFSVKVKVVCETRDIAHSISFKKTLLEKYKNVSWSSMEI